MTILLVADSVKMDPYQFPSPRSSIICPEILPPVWLSTYPIAIAAEFSIVWLVPGSVLPWIYKLDYFCVVMFVLFAEIVGFDK